MKKKETYYKCLFFEFHKWKIVFLIPWTLPKPALHTSAQHSLWNTTLCNSKYLETTQKNKFNVVTRCGGQSFNTEDSLS